MSALFAAALFLCPAGGVIDRVEGPVMVVLGESGVRTVARDAVSSSRPHGPREGDRIEYRAGSCRAVAPTRAEMDALIARLRALGAR